MDVGVCFIKKEYGSKSIEPVSLDQIKEHYGSTRYFCTELPDNLKDDDLVSCQQYLCFDGGTVEIAFVSNKDNIIISKSWNSEELEKKKENNGKNYWVTDVSSYCCKNQYYIEENGNSIKVTVEVVPAISKADFKEMIKGLQMIYYNLVASPKGSQLNTDNKRLTLSEKLIYRVKNIDDSIAAIEMDPQSNIVGAEQYALFDKVKCIDVKVIMDHYVMRKPKVRTVKHERSYDIYENYQIYQYLLKLYSLIKYQMELQEPHYSGNTIATGPAGDLCSAKKRIEALLKKDIFRNLSVYDTGLHSTNLFVNHPWYSKAYKQMQGFFQIDDVSDAEYTILVKKMWDIYEKWCFFNVMFMLINVFGYVVDGFKKSNVKDVENGDGRMTELNVNPIEPYESSTNKTMPLEEYLLSYLEYGNDKGQQTNSLENTLFRLTKKEGEEEKTIYIGYNYVIKDIDREPSRKIGYRPDIVIVKIKDGTYFLNTLDAKYHDFRNTAQTGDDFVTQLIEVAAWKYMYCYDENNKNNKGSLATDYCSIIIDDKLPPNAQKVIPERSIILHPDLFDAGYDKFFADPNVFELSEKQSLLRDDKKDNQKRKDIKAMLKGKEYKVGNCMLMPDNVNRNLKKLLEMILQE